MSGGHSEEEIPVPIPNTEVKLLNADDTAIAGKQVAAGLFFLNRRLLQGGRLFCFARQLPTVEVGES